MSDVKEAHPTVTAKKTNTLSIVSFLVVALVAAAALTALSILESFVLVTQIVKHDVVLLASVISGALLLGSSWFGYKYAAQLKRYVGPVDALLTLAGAAAAIAAVLGPAQHFLRHNALENDDVYQLVRSHLQVAIAEYDGKYCVGAAPSSTVGCDVIAQIKPIFDTNSARASAGEILDGLKRAGADEHEGDWRDASRISRDFARYNNIDYPFKGLTQPEIEYRAILEQATVFLHLARMASREEDNADELARITSPRGTGLLFLWAVVLFNVVIFKVAISIAKYYA